METVLRMLRGEAARLSPDTFAYRSRSFSMVLVIPLKVNDTHEYSLAVCVFEVSTSKNLKFDQVIAAFVVNSR